MSELAKEVKSLKFKIEVLDENIDAIQYGVYDDDNDLVGLMTLEAPYNINEAKRKKIELY